MGSITLQRVTTGTEITVNEFNSNCATLENEINGGLDNSNINASAGIQVSKLAAGTDGYFLRSSSGTPVWAANPLRVINQTGTQVDIVNSVTETTIYTHSVAANALGANGSLRVVLAGDLVNNSGSDRSATLKISFGGTTFYQDALNAAGLVNAANRRAWLIDFILQNANATNSQHLNGLFTIGRSTAPTTGIGSIGTLASYFVANFGSDGSNPTIDTTSAQTLTVTITLSFAHASFDWRLKSGTTILQRT